MSDITNQIHIPTNSFYHNRGYDQNFINCMYAFNIALDNKLSNLFFLSTDDEAKNRIIYSTTAFALRNRAGKNQWNSMNLPFYNYYQTGLSNNTTRRWFNHQAAVDGVYVEELGKKFKINPVHINYEGTYWYGNDYDLQCVHPYLLEDDRLETIVSYNLLIDGQLVKNIAILTYDFNYSPNFTELDWLEKNKIRASTFNISVDTFFIKDDLRRDTEYVSIPNEVIVDFLSSKKSLSSLTDTDWSLAQRLHYYFS